VALKKDNGAAVGRDLDVAVGNDEEMRGSSRFIHVPDDVVISPFLLLLIVRQTSSCQVCFTASSREIHSIRLLRINLQPLRHKSMLVNRSK
jgi:hypothetical protein